MVQVEIYCERLRDLLSTTTASEDLSVQRDAVYGYYVAGTVRQTAADAPELQRVIDAGLTNRAVRSTKMNEESSRSHLLINLFLRTTASDDSAVHSKLTLADLAGAHSAAVT